MRKSGRIYVLRHRAETVYFTQVLEHKTHLLSTEQAAGVYHRESRKGRYQLTYREAKAVCGFEGGALATYDQLEAARKIGLCIF